MNNLDQATPATHYVDGTNSKPFLMHGAVSWSAIFAGTAAAAALSLILLILGTGLGLASISPWSQAGISAASFGISTIIWITLTQVLASGMGGYLAGRLRTKWIGVHVDEVHFRDTAHGFLAWSLATLLTATLLSSAVGSIFSSGAKAGAAAVGGAVSATSSVAGNESAGASSPGASDSLDSSSGYFVDALFRKDESASSSTTTPETGNQLLGSASGQSTPPPTAEVARIFISALHVGTLPPEDLQYVGQLVAKRTGLSQADAEKRVSDTFNQARQAVTQAENSAKEAAEKARKTSSYAALWLFISLLIGAFLASYAAIHGGRQRDL